MIITPSTPPASKEVPLWSLDDCHGDAVISPCERYRYLLTRRAKTDPRFLPWILYVLLNPSKATAVVPDPTMKKCFGFAWRAGFYGFRIVNLFGFRSTEPKGLLSVLANEGEDEAVGIDNNQHLIQQVRSCHASHGMIVVAWGANGAHHLVLPRVADVMQQLRHEQKRCAAKGSGQLDLHLHCLGMTKGDDRHGPHPKHPLMIGYKQPILPLPDTYYPAAA